MDFSNRSTQQAPTGHPGTPLSSASATGKVSRSSRGSSKWWRLGSIGLLFGIVILVIALLGLLYLGTPTQGKFVKTNQYQAVFLTNGQVYFGHIKDINSNFINLENIYYLQSSAPATTSTSTTTTTPANNNVTLIKLGCELHAPYDQMIINVSQVSFWENIQPSGQVGKGIAQLKTCTQSTSTSQSSTSAQTSTQNPASSNKP